GSEGRARLHAAARDSADRHRDRREAAPHRLRSARRPREPRRGRMIFEIVTLFPELFTSVLEASLLGKAVATGALAVHFTNPRDFTHDKHRSVDDTPYGGGAGMVMRPGPLVEAIEHVVAQRGPAHKIALCPTGAPITQAVVNRLAALPRVLL